jgi:hypothetical protein
MGKARSDETQLAPKSLTETTHSALSEILAEPPSADGLNRALRLLAKWRGQLVANTIQHRDGPLVQGGPFAGMSYATRTTEGARAARILGGYEASLAPVIEEIVAGPYRTVVDIGAAEGYYAVGLARRMSGVRILARDASEGARAACRSLAIENGVLDRIDIGGLFAAADFAALEGPVVVICDIEGAEGALLDPALAPALRGADILVECHDASHPGTSDLLAARFAASHEVIRIGRRLAPEVLPAWMESFNDLDRLLALWEWRAGPTPWLWMRAR